MKVRGKLKVASIDGNQVNFITQYDTNDISEDNSFAAATPSASATFNIDNPEALKQFAEGKFYYFDILPVDGGETEGGETE